MKEKTGRGTGLSIFWLSSPVIFASEMNNGGSGGKGDAGSFFEGGANPAIPDPSNMPSTDVTQQNGEKEPYGPTRT